MTNILGLCAFAVIDRDVSGYKQSYVIVMSYMLLVAYCGNVCDDHPMPSIIFSLSSGCIVVCLTVVHASELSCPIMFHIL
jgi:hypothetical protein